MGPRSDERGNRSSLVFSSVIQGLQWGRARMSAEMNAELAELLVPSQLQWGRARMSAEINVAQKNPGGTLKASMGPRSDERGNAEACPKFGPAYRLQWGRARMSAEMPLPPAINGNVCNKLQWGRARMSAEI